MLEVFAEEIKRRFNQPDLKTIRDVEQFIINASNNEKFDINDRILKRHFENSIDCVHLKNYLSMLPTLIRTTNSDSIPIKKVTNLRTVANAMKISVTSRNAHRSTVDKLL